MANLANGCKLYAIPLITRRLTKVTETVGTVDMMVFGGPVDGYCRSAEGNGPFIVDG